MKAYKIDVYGRVQGVSFRFYTCKKAEELSIKGTVKNVTDGSVQIIAEGDENNIESFIKWCHIGPYLAMVNEVKVVDTDFYGYSEFRIVM